MQSVSGAPISGLGPRGARLRVMLFAAYIATSSFRLAPGCFGASNKNELR
jgi:hypothetical protein